MIASLLLSLTLSANAVPLQLTQQGRLLDGSGASVTGVHTLTFRVYTDVSGGSVLWSESLTVQFNNGYYATVLGTDTQNNALDSDTLLNYPVYLEIQLDANAPMSPRQAINSAPYAQIAGIAESVQGGSVDADTISIQGSPVVDGTGTWVGQPVTPQWTNVQGIPSGFSDDVDDVLSGPQVINYVENESNINLANGAQVGGNTIITSATVLQPDWSNITGKPAGFLDNTDNVLSPGEVESYIESTSTLNLNSNTQIGGASILTPNSNLNWNNLQNVPTGLDDGDELDLLESSCSSGEIVGWNGSNWVCVSDNTLTPSEVGTYISNNAYNLNSNTTIGGATILTDVDNTLVGLGMSCQDGDIARYDGTLGEWYCDTDIDTDTQLSEGQVETYITNGAINLASNSKVNGSNIITTATDQNTQLSESEVETYITNASIGLASGSTMGGSTIVTTATDSDTLDSLGCSTGEIAKYDGSAWVCATDVDTDTNTQLSESQVETYVTNGSLSLASGTTLNGQTIVTTATDQNTQLSESQVETYVTNGAINLASNSKVNGSNIVTTATDQNTQLSESQVETYVTNGAVNLASGSKVNGSNIVTTATDSDSLGDLNCSTDQIAQYNGSAWVCADNAPSGTLTYANIYTNSVTSSTSVSAGGGYNYFPAIAYCNDANDIVLHGGCSLSNLESRVTINRHLNGADSSQISGWECRGSNPVTADVVCLSQ